MSVQITIGKNQGITQAIRDKIGATNIKNADLKTWQAVVKLVDSNPQSQSIFKKQGNNNTQLTTDANKINDKSSNHSNYVVDQGTVTIDNGIWAKIEKLLTGSKTENVGAKGEINFNENLNELIKKEDEEAEFAEIDKRKAQAEAKADFEKSLHANPIQNPLNARVESKIDTDNINIPVVATGKQLTRSVNGTQQKIEIQNVNGQKVRFAVNDDGTRGEELVTVSTTGKNTYQTKSEFNKIVRNTLGLKEGQNLPENLKPFYVEIGGNPQLMFKSDNGTLTPKQAAEYCKQHIAQGAGEYEGKSFKDISKDVLSKMDYSKLPSSLMEYALKNDGVQLNYGGTMYTVQQRNLVDAQGNKFRIEGNKLVPIKTAQEPMQAQTQHGNLNFDNDAPSSLWGKRGEINFE